MSGSGDTVVLTSANLPSESKVSDPHIFMLLFSLGTSNEIT